MSTIKRVLLALATLQLISKTLGFVRPLVNAGSRVRNALSSAANRMIVDPFLLISRSNRHHASVRKATLVEDMETGPQISARKRALVEQFAENMGSSRKRAIQRVLIANNGMAATKAILSLRQWAYVTFGDERAIEFVALATRDDLNANAEFIRLADTFVEVPSGSNKNNYANVDLIVSIAEAQKVDAVWPGWGHASENPRLPRSLKAKGIQFIGPTAPVMAALGDKISANILAQTALVPSIPWSGGGLTSGLNAAGIIPTEVFKKACIFSADEAAKMADTIGYPVMIKASEGGGGKGIRMAKTLEELRTGFVQVQNEVPGSPIFMMQLCTQARHLEVQIVGDEYGNAVALNGRDCSTQRRFQKIFEEGPPSIAPKEVFRQMELSAQRLTQSIGYIGAGTVEYLFNAATGKYYFLELNPRLQVEHPVTEGLTGINLPSVQLQVAMGIPLDRIPEVRNFYGRDPEGTDKIDFFEDQYVYPNKHVIAARITAENPDEGFKPTSGRIERVKFQSTPHVWGYFSVGANGGIHEFADSQFGHLFASGPTREAARKALVLALKEIDVRGDVRTTVEYLIKLLETREFKENTIDTAWLDGLIREKAVSVLVEPHTVALSAAIFRAHSAVQSQSRDLLEALAKGQTGLQAVPAMLLFPIEVTFDNVKYAFTATTLGPNMFKLKINGQEIDVRIREQPDKSLLCTVGGESYQLFGQDEALGLRMKINGATVMIPTVYNPSELRSDVTGKIVRFLQADGEQVEKDTPFVEVEAMKMIMSIKASESGVISHALSAGSILAAGDLIASLKLKDPSRVKAISVFRERLSMVPAPTELTFDDSKEQLEFAIQGYEHDVDTAIKTFISKSVSLEETTTFFSSLLTKFLSVESVFDAGEESEVVSALIKANKDSLVTLLPVLVAHKQLKSRSKTVMTIIRQIEFLGEKFPDFRIENIPDALRTALSQLASLSKTTSGEISLKAKQLLDEASTPPFNVRLVSLKDALLAGKTDATSLSLLAKQPNLAVSVDLLTVLFRDDVPAVRVAALEVYLRRVYRAHCIKSLVITEMDGLLTASWTFTIREIAGLDAQLTPVRSGFMAMLTHFSEADIERGLPKVLSLAADHLPKRSAAATTTLLEPLNVLHIGFAESSGNAEDASARILERQLERSANALKSLDVRSVNVLLVNPGKKVGYFNFYSQTGFKEDLVSRNMRPTLPQLLEINRLIQNHNLLRLPTLGRNSQLYLGTERDTGGLKGRPGDKPQVLFLRSISNSEGTVSASGAERVLLMAMDELDRAMQDSRVTDTASSRVFLNILPDVKMQVDECVTAFKRIMDAMISKYATRLLKLRVDEIEVKIRVQDSAGTTAAVPVRLIASSFTGGWLTREAYREYIDPVTGQSQQYCTLSSGSDSEKDMCVIDPYPTSNKLQQKRASARRTGSTYATDFLGLLEVALINVWQGYHESVGSTASPPPTVFAFDELILSKDGKSLIKEKRFPGENKIGMLAWQCTLKTPQYPQGREVIIIANDVTVQSGSFGVQEDEFFFKASEYARQRGLPRVFISCNSGARIGLVDELKPKFRVSWKDENSPGLGYEYLYLEEADYLSLPAGTVLAHPVAAAGGETRYALDAIIGQIHGIGVENLRGSGLIAGETSRAYDETFTLSYVTGRSVGIGAYLNRLGQRVIQMQQGPMILTGYSALNKLLGKEVYTSQDQLGGPQIMYPNGITHEVVQNDKEGMQAVVEWLNYTPKTFTSTSPAVLSSDLPSRPVEFLPTKTPYDPRHMLAGTTNSDGTFVSGFFDRGSFKEYLGGWGKSVVTGRARLGGINVGVIAVETRLVEQRIPADPGNPESREAIQPQAGQVWYPDSAYKTAQAIQDFNRGENLPLIIFANWRGFSGGTRDMYGEILKFGAMIVDALRTYKHPVFVYIPPNGELRGGAWVVIDPTINIDKMEMYADAQARGGILEPPGICEVKYRAQEQRGTMHRLDPVLIELDSEMATGGDSISESEKERLGNEIMQREKLLAPLYLQVAHEFADLHDRSGRMKAKGCISEILDWRSSREFFYWRIRRRQLEDAIKDQIVEASAGSLTFAEAGKKLSELFTPEDNKAAVSWLESSNSQIAALLRETKVAFAAKSLGAALSGLSADEKRKILTELANE